jgi:hypothetical protein
MGRLSGRGIDHPPPYSAKVKERVELYLYSPSGPSWPVLGRTLPLSLWDVFGQNVVTQPATMTRRDVQCHVHMGNAEGSCLLRELPGAAYLNFIG